VLVLEYRRLKAYEGSGVNVLTQEADELQVSLSGRFIPGNDWRENGDNVHSRPGYGVENKDYTFTMNHI
jgi:hypothetical protein